MSGLTWLRRNVGGGGPRDAGPPRSPNGASSFHLMWELPSRPGPQPRLVEVSAVLEVLVPPQVRALYFWALQVDLADAAGVWGGGHTGLQWNRRYPGGTAVNWGGYASAELGGAVLPGTESSLPGLSDDLNTLAYPWQSKRRYRIRVHRSPEIKEAWRSEVTDLESGLSTTIRDLLPAPGREGLDSYLTRPLVWSEVFADCDAPSVTVRWSELAALDESGTVVKPEAVRVNYQSFHAGGCPNTSVSRDETGGVLQVTNVPRALVQGASLPLSGPSAAHPS
jgi:hypothetical protein